MPDDDATDATDDGTLIERLLGLDDDDEPDGVATAVEGNRAEWRPSGGDGPSLDATTEASYGAGAAEPVGGEQEQFEVARKAGGNFPLEPLKEGSFGDGASTIEPIEGNRAEWRPSGGPDIDASGAGTYVDDGGTEARLHVADDVKLSDDGGLGADEPHEVDIGGGLEEPTEIWLGPAEGGDGLGVEPGAEAVTEVSDVDAPLAVRDTTKFEDVD